MPTNNEHLSTLPRGLRNNNPGNIRRTSVKWQGEVSNPTDKEFEQFVSVEYGYRALIVVLRNYKKLHGCHTISDMIRRWAPDNENNTAAYVTSVCRQLQVPSSFCPDIDDRDTMCNLAAAISFVENGITAEIDKIYRAWELL